MEEGLQWPVESYTTGDYLKFRDRIRRHKILWATHLGDDVAVGTGTLVKAIGAGEVVLAKILPGSKEHRSWGGVVVLKHKTSNINHSLVSTGIMAGVAKSSIQEFFSIYGHIKDLRAVKGDQVTGGHILGEVAEGYTAENGWWKQPHLHFGIYTGPWQGEVLPGYWRPEQFWRTRLAWWHDPQNFIKEKTDSVAN